MRNAVCVCGHSRELHEHYRRRSDCAICGPEACGAFRARRTRWPARLFGRRDSPRTPED